MAIVMSIMFVPAVAMPFDVSGVRPAAPYGGFYVMSAFSPKQGESAVAFSVEKSGGPDFMRYSTQLAFGVLDTLEFGANVPYVDQEESTGLGDIGFSLKHRVVEWPRTAMSYMVFASMASNNEEFSTGGRYGAGLALSARRIGPFQAHLNLSYAIPRDDGYEDELRGIVGLEFSASHSFKMLAEFDTCSSHYSTEVDQSEFRFGYRFGFQDLVLSTIGVGLGLNGKQPDYRLFASLSFLFPNIDETLSGAGR